MRPLSSVLPALLLLSACAANPPANEALEQARAAVGAARSDPHAPTLAPGELELAARTLNDAERLAKEGAPAEYVSHRAYVAEQRARIARETATARATEAQADKAREQRRAQLEERAREAEAARERAEALAREQEQKLAALEQARETAQSRRLVATEQFGAEVQRLEASLPELQARETDRGWVFALPANLMFESGNATLKPAGRRSLGSVARLLRQHPERNVLVEGFADTAAGDDHSRHLAERRAHEVRNALVLAGVDGARIIARGQQTAEGRIQIVVADDAARAATGGGAQR